jgi:hypothetical protein
MAREPEELDFPASGTPRLSNRQQHLLGLCSREPHQKSAPALLGRLIRWGAGPAAVAATYYNRRCERFRIP